MTHQQTGQKELSDLFGYLLRRDEGDNLVDDHIKINY
jgi:hypothetical protein